VQQSFNVFVGVFVFYHVATAWMTVRRGESQSGAFEKVALLVALCLCAPFGILTFQLLTGVTAEAPTAAGAHYKHRICAAVAAAGFLFFWMIRVILTGWRPVKRHPTLTSERA
jgi:hypothetical protein